MLAMGTRARGCWNANCLRKSSSIVSLKVFLEPSSLAEEAFPVGTASNVPAGGQMGTGLLRPLLLLLLLLPDLTGFLRGRYL